MSKPTRSPEDVPLVEGFLHRGDPDPELAVDPFTRWDEVRETYGAFRTDARDPDYNIADENSWYLTRFDDVYAAFGDWETFSSEVGRPWILQQTDPPEHTKYRALLNPKFTPRAIRDMEPLIRERCAEVMDAVVDKGGCEFVSEVANEFPTVVFMKVMGLPVERSTELIGWAHDLMHSDNSEEGQQHRGAAYQSIIGLLTELIEARRAEPRDDLMTYLVQCEVDGRPLEDQELQGLTLLLYMAGLDTVAGTMGYIWRHLADNDEHRRLLCEQPERISDAIEEFLRYYPIVMPPRRVTQDVEFAGCPMAKGDLVYLSIPGANRDPRAFERSDELVFGRRPNRHIGFAHGPHRCLGSHLARTELRIAIEEWHRRIPDYEIVDRDKIVHRMGLHGLDRLHLVW